MKLFKYIVGIYLLGSLVSYGSKNNTDTNTTEYESNIPQPKSKLHTDKDSLLISSIYDKFVFAVDTDGNDNPDDYFTSNALKKLQDDFDSDCDNDSCYAYYALRTEAQDSKPGAEDVSQISSIEPIGDEWYVVSYLDMGWSGMTRVKIVNGKIDDYERCVSEL